MNVDKSFVVYAASLLSFAFLLFLGGCVTGKQAMLDDGMKPLTAEELQTVFAEKRTGNWHNAKKNVNADVFYLPDGSMGAEAKGKTYSGKYSLKGNEFCATMDHRPGERCETYFKIGENKYKVFERNGSLRGILTLNE